jgi:putative transposase
VRAGESLPQIVQRCTADASTGCCVRPFMAVVRRRRSLARRLRRVHGHQPIVFFWSFVTPIHGRPVCRQRRDGLTKPPSLFIFLLLFEARSGAFSLCGLSLSFWQGSTMSGNYYSEINLHITWHTKDSLPLITARIEPVLYGYLRQRIVNTPGMFVHQIGGMETHIHLALTVQPTIQISDLIGQLKGSSSHEVNQTLSQRDRILQWQSGYGVVSFGTGDLEWVIDYIRRQKEHHAHGRIHARLERIVCDASGTTGRP